MTDYVMEQGSFSYIIIQFFLLNKSCFVVVGTSFYTGISEILLKLAKQRKANIIIVQDDACVKVPRICENLKYRLTR